MCFLFNIAPWCWLHDAPHGDPELSRAPRALVHAGTKNCLRFSPLWGQNLRKRGKMALAPGELQKVLPCLCGMVNPEPCSCPKSWNWVIFQQARGSHRVAVAGRRAKPCPRDHRATGPAEFPFFSCLFSSQPPAAGNRQPFVVQKPVPGDV